MRSLVLFLVCLLLAKFSIVFAEEPFVFQSVRSMGMGGILSRNPAMLTEIKQKTITSSASYQDFSMQVPYPFGPCDFYLSHIGYLISYTQPNLCIGFNHWQRGDRKTEITLAYATEDEKRKWKDLGYETSLLLGAGKQILPSFSIGANIKYLRADSDWEKVAEKIFDPDQAISCDIGVLFNPIPQIKIFSTFYNALGSKIEYWIYVDGGSENIAQELPENLSLGVSFSPNSKTLLGIQISHLLEEKVECNRIDYQFKRTLNLGGEITPVPCLSLRTGLIITTVPSYYNYFEESYHYVKRNIPTMGFGYRYKHIEIDFASIFDNRKKDIEEFSTVSSATSTFRYMLGASWIF
ncbi:hypothetical protein KAW50_07115 [candidate division WOR-3 bacterium]|nr:hypothetical protein [candidate division WOR-3 bacterium]